MEPQAEQMSTPSLVEQIVHRTCARAAYEFDSLSKVDPVDVPFNIFSLGFLKALHDNPEEYLGKLLAKTGHCTEAGQKILTVLNDIKNKPLEQRFFIEFLNRLNELETPEYRQWSELRHFMYYVYRHFVSANPSTRSQNLPVNFVDQMRVFVVNLLHDDESQFLFRIYSLLRDYCIKAHLKFAKSCENGQISITKVFYYYEALLAAARSIGTIFPEIETILQKNYTFSWIDFNTCIFINYFFESGIIQSRIFDLNRNDFSPNDTPAMLNTLSDLKNNWYRQQGQVNKISGEAVLEVDSPFRQMESVAVSQHRKVLSTDFWINRSKTEKKSIYLKRLDHHIFNVISDEEIQFSNSLIDDDDCCTCEECLVTKYKLLVNATSPLSQTKGRLISCHRCHTVFEIDFFMTHIQEHCGVKPKVEAGNEEKTIEGSKSFNSVFTDFVANKSKTDDLKPEIDNLLMSVLNNFREENADDENNSPEKTEDDIQTYDIPDEETLNCMEQIILNQTPYDPVHSMNPQSLLYANLLGMYSSKQLDGNNGDLLACDFAELDISDLGGNNGRIFDEETEIDVDSPPNFLDVLSSINLDSVHDFPDILDTTSNISDSETVKIPSDEESLKSTDSSAASSQGSDETIDGLIGLMPVPDDEITAEEEINVKTDIAFREFLKQSKGVKNFIKVKKDIFYRSISFADKVYENAIKVRSGAGLGATKPAEAVAAPEPPPPPPVAPPTTTSAQVVVERENNITMQQLAPQHNNTPSLLKDSKLEAGEEKMEAKKAVGPARSACDHHKEKKCDCKYCGVFGTSVTTHSHKSNELRDRLRIRLHQRREKRNKEPIASRSTTAVAASTTPLNARTEERVPPTTQTVPTPIANEPHGMHLEDIPKLLNFIHGNNSVTNVAETAEKKAAKKARQRIKKEEERLKLEEQFLDALMIPHLQNRSPSPPPSPPSPPSPVQNIGLTPVEKKAAKKERQRMKKEEERRKLEEAERERENLKQLEERLKKEKELTMQMLEKNLNNMSLKDSKKKKGKNKPEIIEETIPAMVTIKRVIENGNSEPTVTVTLQGSNPDQEKLFYTLVKANDPKREEPASKPVPNAPATKNKSQKADQSQKSNKKKKNKVEEAKPAPPPPNQIIAKDLKVTIALDQSNMEPKKTKKQIKAELKKVQVKQQAKVEKDASLDLPIRLPPGITITKVEGPLSNRNIRPSALDEQPPGSTINVSKSGVIVVDTEKLIQQTAPPASKSKKNKKKKTKKGANDSPVTISSAPPSGQMITLKNPIFQSMQPPSQEPMANADPQCAPAAIFTSANGMVTIRSSRLQQSLNQGASALPTPPPRSSLLSDLKPVVGPDVPASYSRETPQTAFSAQKILLGLPGIQITKVDKQGETPEVRQCRLRRRTPQVSIVPTSNESSKFNLEKDDWMFGSRQD